jgi:hypothetical protein
LGTANLFFFVLVFVFGSPIEEEERKRQQAWAEFNAQQEALRRQQEGMRRSYHFFIFF